MKLTNLDILDLRSRLPRASWSIGSQTVKMSATLHYNGPPVKAFGSRNGEIAQLVADAHWHMRPVAFGAGEPGDGLQYHFAVLSDGTICQCRDLDAVLWHCANQTGNASSLSVHLPLGGAQDATELQWQRTTALFDALGAQFKFGRTKVVGHQEWAKYIVVNNKLVAVPNSACPGPILMKRLRAWRESKLLQNWRVLYDDSNIREAPTSQSPIALQGKAKVNAGQTFVGDEMCLGEYIGGTNHWIHRADGLGFVHRSLLEPVS